MAASANKRYFGAHVSSAGGLENAVLNGKELGVNSIQLHPAAPQRWNTKPFADGIEEAFIREREGSGIDKVFFHGIYLINLANPDPRLQGLARNSLAYFLELNHRLNGDGVIFHVGSMKDEPNEQAGYARISESINWILNKARGEAKLLLEVAAGSGNIVGDRVEELAEIFCGIEDQERVGFALDSQHLWASGYDLVNKLDEVIDNVDSALGLDKVFAFHLNDSKTDLGSRVDRHENLGNGKIGEAALRRLVTHPRLAHIPFVLETPDLKSLETAHGEVKKLRQYIEGGKNKK